MKEIRYDHREHFSARGKLVPASFEIYFEAAGSEIAWYNSREDTLFLKTDYIASKNQSDFRKPYTERIVGSPYEAEYKNLLLRYAASKLSEYTF